MTNKCHSPYSDLDKDTVITILKQNVKDLQSQLTEAHKRINQLQELINDQDSRKTT
jgi:predicted  nucleic acid-binding Zn-ribbon protein